MLLTLILRALFRYSETLLRTGSLSERRKAARRYVKDDEFVKSTLYPDIIFTLVAPPPYFEYI